MLSVLGGKITAYRGIAEEVVDRVCRKLGRGSPGRTATLPLPGGRVASLDALCDECAAASARCGLTPEQARHLAALYGARYEDVLERVRAAPVLAAPLHPDYPDLRAQVHDAVLAEGCRTASDFLMRRSLLYFTPDQGRAALDAVIAEMATVCDWDESRCEEERAGYQRALELSAVPSIPASL
jgi:glycerol-3-phosphate dehydrogenase